MIEIECRRCHAKHRVPTLYKSLLCCSVPTGVTQLVAQFYDPETKERWFTVSKAAIVRAFRATPKRRT